MKKFRKLLAGILTLAMLVTMMPATVMAAGTLEADDAATLKAALESAASAGAGDTTINITADIDMTNVEWTPVYVDGYNGADIVTVNGNNHKITSLTAPLFAGGFAGDSGIVINNLTIVESTIDSTNETGSGAFIEYVDSMKEITLDNCHLLNSTVKGSRTGGLIGYTAGYDKQDDGPVDTYVTVTNCSVSGCAIKGSSVGAIVGHAGANSATYTTIKNCTITNNKLISNDDGGWRVGVVVGTANVGEVTIENISAENNTLTQDEGKSPIDGQTNLVGRFVAGSTGYLEIDGVEYATDCKPQPPEGSVTPAYTKEVDGYVRVWGEGGGDAKESLVLELYSGETLMATTKLNNVDGIIDGEVYVTWNFYYPESNDEYWTTTWEEGHPQSAMQPSEVVLYIDGVKVATNEAQMNGADNVNPVTWRELGGVAQTDIVADENGEFIINNLADLKAFAAMVNAGNNFSGKTVKLAADIDLNNEEWTPIGNSSNPFNGTFNGQSYKISNLNVAMAGKSDAGLFGRTNDGEIKNLTIENATVTGRLNVGVVAGTPYTSKYTNIKVTGHVEVNGMSYVGGVGGKNAYADWTNITVAVDDTSYVKADSVENGTAYRTYVGGVIGFMGEGSHKFENITSNIDVIGSTCDIGGITGIAHYGNSFINVTCSGDVTTYADNVDDACESGGIAGVWHNGGSPVTFKGMTFTGDLSAPNVKEDFTFPNAGLIGGAYSKTGTGELKSDVVAYIGDTTFTSLSDALNAAGADDIVYLMTGVNVTEDKQFTVSAQQTITLNLNGGTLTCNGFLNYGTLNIMNGTVNGIAADNSTIESTGTLNVTDLNVTAVRHGIRVEGGEAVIDGGTYTANGYAKRTQHAVNVSDGGKVTIKDGTFIGPKGTASDSGAAVNCQADSTVIIEGGKFSGGKLNTLSAKGELVVKSGIFDQDPSAFVADGYKVKDNEDATYIYRVTGYSTNVGHGFQTIVSESKPREAITTTLEDVYAAESLVVKVYSGNTLLSTTTLREYDLDDTEKTTPLYPVTTEEITANIVISGKEAGSWETVWNVTPTRNNIPTKIEVYADGKLTDIYTDADGCFLDADEKAEYISLFPEIVDVPSTSGGGGGGSTKYKVSIDADEIENGTVKANNTKVSKGSTVTLTVTPDDGYELDELTVLDKDGEEVELTDKGNGKFTFKMPRGGVEVEASFEEIDEDVTADETVADESAVDGKEETILILTIDQVIYQLNGEYKVNDVAPIIKGERTMLPIRLVAETLGATVTWNEADQAVTIVKGDTTIVIYIGQAFALVNGEPVQLDAPAFIANDRTYLPVRFVAENLGATVTWDGTAQTVTIVG